MVVKRELFARFVLQSFSANCKNFSLQKLYLNSNIHLTMKHLRFEKRSRKMSAANYKGALTHFFMNRKIINHVNCKYHHNCQAWHEWLQYINCNTTKHKLNNNNFRKCIPLCTFHLIHRLIHCCVKQCQTNFTFNDAFASLQCFSILCRWCHKPDLLNIDTGGLIFVVNPTLL